MTLVSDLITSAYRESNLISITAVPTALEQAEALTLLNRLVLSYVGDEAGEQLNPIAIGRNNISKPSGYPWYDQIPNYPDWFVPANVRLVLNLTAPQTVYLSPTPTDGQRFAIQDKSGNLATNPLTVIANGRTLAGQVSQVFNTNNFAKEWLYRDDIGDWTVVTPLALTDTFTFPMDFDDMFAIGLAMRLNPRNGQTMDPQSADVYKNGLNNFKSRYRQHKQVGSELALIRTLGIGSQRNYLDNVNYSQSAFNSGYPFIGVSRM